MILESTAKRQTRSLGSNSSSRKAKMSRTLKNKNQKNSNHAYPLRRILSFQHTAFFSPYNPKPFLTLSFTILSYSPLFSLHIRAASTFAGLSSFGSASMLMTEMRIFSTLWMGLHRSDACS